MKNIQVMGYHNLDIKPISTNFTKMIRRSLNTHGVNINERTDPVPDKFFTPKHRDLADYDR